MRSASLFWAVALAAGTMVHQAAACGLSRLFGGPAAPTTFSAAYTPYSVAYQPAAYTAYYPLSCGPSCAQPVGVYRAGTYYRVAYPVYGVAYPAVAVQPAVGCSTCGGVAVTTYRPAFIGPWRVGFAPYVTQRVVYANPCPLPGTCVPACGVSVDPCGGACGTAAYSVPSLGALPSASSVGCGCAPASSTPTTTYYVPPSQTIVPEPSSAYTPEAPSASTAEPPATEPPERKTFEQQAEPEERIDLNPIPEGGPIPDTSPIPETAPVPETDPVPPPTSPAGVSPLPRLIPPEGPTASRDVRATGPRLVPVRLVSTAVLDDSGWRPSHQ